MKDRAIAAFCMAVSLSACSSDPAGTVATPAPTPTPSPTPTPTPIPTPTASAYAPARGATAAYKDTRLQISFDAPPTIGTAGTVRVYKADGTLVDTIDISGAPVTAGGETQTRYAAANTEVDQIGNNVANLTQYRFVYYRPVTVAGNVATIRLHDNVLDWSTAYYVTISDGVLRGTVGGTAFAGVSGTTGWTFTTKAAPASQTAVTVDDDGTAADFRTVQGALDWQMANGCTSCANTSSDKSITIRAGTYDEQLFLRNVNNLTIRGDSRQGSIVRYDNWEAFNPSTGGSRAAANTTLSAIGGNVALGTRRSLGGGRSVFLIEGGDNLRLTNFTLRNTHVKDAETNSQAETMYFNSAALTGARLAATDMDFISTQDTVQVKGWVWFYNSLIAGDVDFVWGSPYAMLIENSELRTVADTSAPTSGGYIFQSRAAKGYPGFVVLNSSLTSAAGVPTGATYLARSAGLYQAAGYCTTPLASGSLANANIYCDNIAYINTRMGDHIASVGWYTQPLPNLAPTATEGWRESGSTRLDGSPLDLSSRDRVNASTTIDLSGLASRATVFRQWNGGAGWAPMP